jgi:hypothetical protein
MHVRDEDLVETLSAQVDDGPLLGAVYARVDTAVGFTRMFTPLGNYLIARPAARAKAQQVTDETDVPLDAAMVLGMTAGAMHVWSADPMLGQVHDHLGSVPRDVLAGIDVGAGRSWQPLTLNLADGHRIEVEARGNVHQFVTAAASQ